MMSMRNESPILALTMGDPAGVGPEIIAGAWPFFFTETQPEGTKSASKQGKPLSGEPMLLARPVVFGHPEIIRQAFRLRKIDAEIVPIDTLESLEHYDGLFGLNRVPCVPCCNDSAVSVPHGEISAEAGDAAFKTLNRAIDFALAGKVDAIVTAPLHKKSLNLAGHHFPGHTEILATRCGIDDYAMMLYLGPQEGLASPTGLAVVHVTLHTAMKNVFAQITREAVLAKSHLIRNFMRPIKGSEPRIGVAALNCHCGDNGLFGDEEIRIIGPAVAQAQKENLIIAGPSPTDTLMLDAKNGLYDGIVAMYHDQGHIAIKLLGMHRAVNVTLGLPVIRTSVAHGTAFNIAWQGIAKISSMLEAVRVAMLLAEEKKQKL